MKVFAILSLLCALLWHSALTAQVYKWVDENGNIHFSDRPQAFDTEQVDVKVTPPSGSVSGGRSSDASTPAAGGAFNCNTIAANVKRILLNQTEVDVFRVVAAEPDFASGLAAECQQELGTAEGRAEAACLQKANTFSDFKACSK